MSKLKRNPNADLGIIALKSSSELGSLVDKAIVESRRARG